MATTAAASSLFRFVQVRRLSRADRPVPSVPPGVFDFSGYLLPTVVDAMNSDDRDAAATISAALLARLSPPSAAVAGVLVEMLRMATGTEYVTVGDLRKRARQRRITETAGFDDVVHRAASCAVLERWLGRPQSELAAEARRLLQGAVIGRLVDSPLPDDSLMSELIRGGSIVLPRPSRAVPANDFPAPGSIELPAARMDPNTEPGDQEDLPPMDIPTIPGPSLPPWVPRARILGRGDLMIVRIEHARYELGEIAYIENVLRSELRARTNVIDTATSEKIVETSDLFSETSQELTTTERFGLESAASSANTTTTSLSAGMSMSGGFGPVSVGLDLNADHSTSTTDSNSSSTSYAKEVTDRASETMRSSSSSSIVTTNRTRITETNRHDFDNRSGPDHVRGIYRWLNKVDRAQVFNYGERLLLEFIVPEPAATHVYLASVMSVEGAPVPPPSLDFGPEQITEHNFVELGRRFDTAGLVRPPATEIAIAAEFSFPPGQAASIDAPQAKQEDEAPPPAEVLAVQVGEVAIPEGYAAGRVVTSIVYGEGLGLASVEVPDLPGLPSLEFYPVALAIGGRRFTISARDIEESHIVELESRHTGPLPIALGSKQGWGAALAMRVIAYRTDEGLKAWQQSTFEAIQQAYLSKVSAYESELAVAQIRAGYTAVTPSDVNRAIEVRELTRGCQTILTGQHFDLFGSVDFPEDDAPRIDIDEAWIEGDTIQFFSDVFDWRLMAYLFYPYHWAGRDRWRDLVARTSADPLHEAFLQAGTARVVVPVKEGFEHAVARYLREAVVPAWGPEPWRGRPSGFLPVDELIADANDRPGDEVAIGEPWEVVTPTTLVYLQEDAELNPVNEP